MSQDNKLDHQSARRMAWDIYFAGAVSISLHPGATRDGARERTIKECALIADEMLGFRDARFDDE